MIGPTHAPEIETFPRIASINVQVINPAAADVYVLTIANDANPLKNTKNDEFSHEEKQNRWK